MTLLLDTHVLVWFLTGDRRIGKHARTIIDEAENAVFASTVSLWEVAVKWPLRRGGPGDMPFPASIFAQGLELANIEVIASRAAHALALENLPSLHGDPFDRLLIATARCEDMTLLTADTALAEYGDGVRLI